MNYKEGYLNQDGKGESSGRELYGIKWEEPKTQHKRTDNITCIIVASHIRLGHTRLADQLLNPYLPIAPTNTPSTDPQICPTGAEAMIYIQLGII